MSEWVREARERDERERQSARARARERESEQARERNERMNMCTRVTTSVPLAWLSGGGVTAATPVSDRLSMAYYKGERRNNQKRLCTAA